MRATGAMGRRGRGRGSEHRLHLPPLCSLRPDPWVTRPPQFPLQTSALPGSQLTAPRPCCPLTPFSPFPGFGGFPGRRRHSWTHFSDGDTEEQMRLLLNPRSCSNVGAPSAPTSYDPPSPSHSHLYNAPPAPPPCPRPWLPGRPHTHPPAVRNKLLSEDPCLKKKWSLDRLGPFKSLNRGGEEPLWRQMTGRVEVCVLRLHPRLLSWALGARLHAARVPCAHKAGEGALATPEVKVTAVPPLHQAARGHPGQARPVTEHFPGLWQQEQRGHNRPDPCVLAERRVTLPPGFPASGEPASVGRGLRLENTELGVSLVAQC